MSYSNFPFGAGNARNKYFWIFVLVAIVAVLVMFAKKSGYITGMGNSNNVVNDMLSKPQMSYEDALKFWRNAPYANFVKEKNDKNEEVIKIVYRDNYQGILTYILVFIIGILLGLLIYFLWSSL